MTWTAAPSNRLRIPLLVTGGAAMTWHYLRVLSLNRRLVAAGSAHENALQALQASESRYRELIEGS